LTDAKTGQQAKRRNRRTQPALSGSVISCCLVSFNRGGEDARKTRREAPITAEN
jgi:hypothetical protein